MSSGDWLYWPHTRQNLSMTTHRPRNDSGVSTHEIFGSATGAQPAEATTYGRPPSGFRLPDATRLGPVRLRVRDLDRSVGYYRRVLGLTVLELSDGEARLGSADGTVLVELAERPGARPAPSRGRTGLFHFALLLPDRASLGRFVRHLDASRLHAGAADHLVSEALYLQDPDNLGIEIYADRPRSAWRRLGRELMMATDPLDRPGLLDAAGDEPWAGLPDGTVMGHVHLHVGDLDRTAAFYGEGLGLDRTVWGYPGALFFGAGGYHHHLGTNLWAGRDATAPADDEAQLLRWNVVLAHRPSLQAATASLEATGGVVERIADDAVETRDPWGTRLRLTHATTP
jgi:catechol 2,3-dioxygenase